MQIEPQRPAQRPLAEQLAHQRTALLTLRDPQGRLAGRPMTVQRMDAEGRLWMLASRKHLGAAGGTPGAQAHLGFSDESEALYLSVSGPLLLDEDQDLKRTLWSADARAGFPGGIDDPDLVCLALQPEQAKLWDSPDGRAQRGPRALPLLEPLR